MTPKQKWLHRRVRVGDRAAYVLKVVYNSKTPKDQETLWMLYDDGGKIQAVSALQARLIGERDD